MPRDTRHGTGLQDLSDQLGLRREDAARDILAAQSGDGFASFVDSLVGWYPYSGDEEAVQAVREMLDHQLAHGTTPADWEWPGVPFATNCGDQPDYGRCIREHAARVLRRDRDRQSRRTRHRLRTVLQADGRAQVSGSRGPVRPGARPARAAGDAEHTPWPFRVDARTGVTLALEEYGGDVAGSLRLFDELIRLNAGDVACFPPGSRHGLGAGCCDIRSTRRAEPGTSGPATSRIFRAIPMTSISSLPMMAAYYILAREDPAEVDPQWMGHVGRLLDWVKIRLGRGPFFGAQAIDEQTTPDASFGCCSRAGQGDHTARWAAINALFFEKTRDGQAREDAFRSLNYGTYFAGVGRPDCLLRRGLHDFLLVQRRLFGLHAPLPMGHGRGARICARRRRTICCALARWCKRFDTARTRGIPDLRCRRHRSAAPEFQALARDRREGRAARAERHREPVTPCGRCRSATGSCACDTRVRATCALETESPRGVRRLPQDRGQASVGRRDH